MTCIVGLKTESGVVLGGDRAGIDGELNRIIIAQPKVFQLGPYLIGYTTSFRMGQILQYHLRLPVPDEDPPFQHMVQQFVPSARACLLDHGFASQQNNQTTGGEFLVAYRNQLYTIEANFQVTETVDDYAAVGCGARYALGSLFTTGGMVPELRVRLALQTAAHFSAGVLPPFDILWVGDPK